MARAAATEVTDRWKGFTRTLGLQYLQRHFEIAEQQHDDQPAVRGRVADAQESRTICISPRAVIRCSTACASRPKIAAVRYQLRAGARRGESGCARSARTAALIVRAALGAHGRRRFRCAAAGAALLRRRRPLDPRLRLPADRRPQRRGRRDRRRVPDRSPAPSTSTTSWRIGARRSFVDAGDAFTSAVRRQRRRRHRTALEVAGRAGAAGRRDGRSSRTSTTTGACTSSSGPTCEPRRSEMAGTDRSAPLILLLALARVEREHADPARAGSRRAPSPRSAASSRWASVDGTIAGPLDADRCALSRSRSRHGCAVCSAFASTWPSGSCSARRFTCASSSERHRRRAVASRRSRSHRKRRSRSACNRRSTSARFVAPRLAPASGATKRRCSRSTRADFSGRWTARELTLRSWTCDSPQGEIRFAGRVRDANLRGDGTGRFRWTFGERTYAGMLDGAHASQRRHR